MSGVCVYTILSKGIREGPTEEVTSEQDLKIRVRHKYKDQRGDGAEEVPALRPGRPLLG